jgi:hypothetical protein
MPHHVGLMDGKEALMRPSDAPRQVYPLASTALISGSILTAGNFLLAASGQRLGLFVGFGALALTLRAVRTLSTRVTETGVSQLHWGGRVQLSWSEVTQVTRTPRSFTLTGDERRVVVSVEEFQDTAAAISYIESHLRSNFRSNPGAGVS